MLRIVAASLLLLFHCAPAAAAGDARAFPEPLAAATDNAASALSRKTAGDEHAAKGEYREAAEAYERALSLAREAFPAEERTRMAVTMSWGGKLAEAVRELELLLLQDPGNDKARIHLAKSLSWLGRTDEAIAQAEKVLETSPSDADALLAKADALRYKGAYDAAIPIYRKVLELEDDFHARLGLAYIDLARGDVPAAREGLARLAPRYPYQETERKKLAEAIAGETGLNLSPRYTYYSDTDDNRVHRYSVSAGFPVKNWKTELGYRHTDARDLTRSARADDLSLSVHSMVSRRLRIGAGAGASRVGTDDRRTFAAGHVKADAGIYGGTIGVAVSRTVFAETAQLMENGIRFTSVTTTIARPLPRGLSLSGSYSYKDYSDDNASDDVQGSLKYALRRAGPAIGVGYRIRYLDFDRESGGGYFDPSNYVAHQAFATLYYERGRVYTYLEPFFGHQSFTRTGAKTDDTFGGGSGVLGVRLAKKVLLEINAEGGDYAAGAAAGFRYYLVGATLKATF